MFEDELGGGGLFAFALKELAVIRKEAGGSWLCVASIWNSDLPLREVILVCSRPWRPRFLDEPLEPRIRPKGVQVGRA